MSPSDRGRQRVAASFVLPLRQLGDLFGGELVGEVAPAGDGVFGRTGHWRSPCGSAVGPVPAAAGAGPLLTGVSGWRLLVDQGGRRSASPSHNGHQPGALPCCGLCRRPARQAAARADNGRRRPRDLRRVPARGRLGGVSRPVIRHAFAWPPLMCGRVGLGDACGQPQTRDRSAARYQRPDNDPRQGASGVHVVFPLLMRRFVGVVAVDKGRFATDPNNTA